MELKQLRTEWPDIANKIFGINANVSVLTKVIGIMASTNPDTTFANFKKNLSTIFSELMDENMSKQVQRYLGI